MSEHVHDHDHDHENDEVDEAEAEAELRRQFALAQIRQYGDVALRMHGDEVTEFDDDLRRLVERMTALMNDAQGVGLAATQIGVLRRVFVFEPDEDGPRAIINPVVVESGNETDSEEEGCLSLQGVRVPVDRPTAITITGKDETGADVRYELEGYGARIAQHELDHLDGVLIIDRTDDEHRKGALAVLRPRAVLR